MFKVEKLEKYIQILKNKNLKITHPRLEILKYLDKNRNHPSVDKIYTDLKKQFYSLSKTTVYNTLETLSDAGIIKQLTITPQENRYDYDNNSHHHFHCKICKKIYDIDVKCPYMSEINNKTKEQGHKIEEIHGYFKGTCKNCIKKERT